MIRKNIQRKILVDNIIDSCEYELPLQLEYYLLESEVKYNDELKGKKVYGLGIAKKINEACYEEKVVKNFSCNMNETRKIIDKLADNEVTPMTLDFVLDDLLGT